jgi:DNA methylase
MRWMAGERPIMISKCSILGFGINMQHCRNMAFVGLSDSYEALYQSVRRCWRFGQKQEVRVHIITASTEGAVLDNVKRKERDAEEMAARMVGATSDISKVAIQGTARTVSAYETADVSEGLWTMKLGDCVERIRDIADNSVGFSVFSPPFASLYTYSPSDRDMGNCVDDAQFMEHFGFLVRELYRVTKPGRLLSFHCMNIPTSKVKDGVIGLRDFRGELIRVFSAEGWIFHTEICIWKDPVTQMQRTKALGLLHKQLKKDSCMSRQGIPDYLVTMRKPGANDDPVTNTNETFPVGEWQQYASPVWMDINPSDTLQKESAREEQDERHICPLQLEVIRRALRLWSKPGDLVLSPFAGIGSEGYEAVKAGRRFVGLELKPSYFKQACANLRVASQSNRQRSLFGATEVAS